MSNMAMSTAANAFLMQAVLVQDMIAKAVMRGLKACPDIVSMRKELLVATRHNLALPALRSYAPRYCSDPFTPVCCSQSACCLPACRLLCVQAGFFRHAAAQQPFSLSLLPVSL